MFSFLSYEKREHLFVKKSNQFSKKLIHFFKEVLFAIKQQQIKTTSNMTTETVSFSSSNLDLTVCSSFVPVLVRFSNLICNVEGFMDDTCDFNGANEITKKQIKNVIKLFGSKNHPTKWVSKNAFAMGFIVSSLITLIHQMKEDNDEINNVFYNILNSCETHNMNGEINEGQYLELVNTAAKTKKIIDYALRVPYDVANDYDKNYEWVDINGVRYLNIHYKKPTEPVLAQ